MRNIEKCIAALTNKKNQFDEAIYLNIKGILLHVMHGSEHQYNKIELPNTVFLYDAERDEITDEILQEMLKIDKNNPEKAMMLSTEGDNWYIY